MLDIVKFQVILYLYYYRQGYYKMFYLTTESVAIIMISMLYFSVAISVSTSAIKGGSNY